MRRIERVLRILAEAPSTALELAAELKISHKNACEAMRILKGRGMAAAWGHKKPHTGRPATIYMLTVKGQRAAQRLQQ
jgi:predicted ArsR family transcriptional regulator